jgi:hypothetical protein
MQCIFFNNTVTLDLKTTLLHPFSMKIHFCEQANSLE